MKTRPSYVACVVTFLVCSPVHAARGQSASLGGPTPPVAHGFSVVRLELGRPPRLTTTDRSWTPTLHVDVALGNSPTRVALRASRLPGVAGPAPASIGGGLSVTQVLVERESPSWMAWLTGAAGVAGLRHELRDRATALDVSVGAGAAWVFSPPGVGEVSLSVAPGLRWRRLSPVPNVDRSAFGGAATATLDWGSQRSIGAHLALDVEWLSSRPAGDRLTQTTLRVGLSYRRLLFRRKPRLPPPETL